MVPIKSATEILYRVSGQRTKDSRNNITFSAWQAAAIRARVTSAIDMELCHRTDKVYTTLLKKEDQRPHETIAALDREFRPSGVLSH
jgi:hypothetical protein